MMRMNGEGTSDIGVEVHLRPDGPTVTVCVNDSDYIDTIQEEGAEADDSCSEIGSVRSTGTPISAFRQEPPGTISEEERDDDGDSFRPASPLDPDGPDGESFGERAAVLQPDAPFDVPLSPAQSLQLDPSPSWDVRIEREIEEARRLAAQSVVSDRTGMDDRIHNLLFDSVKPPNESTRLGGFLEPPLADPSLDICDEEEEEETQSDYNLDPLPIGRNDYSGRSSSDGSKLSIDRTHNAPIRGRMSGSLSAASTREPLQSMPEDELAGDEKKESDVLDDRKARFSTQLRSHLEGSYDEMKLIKSLGITESDVESVSGLPSRLRSQWAKEEFRRAKLMKSLDGIRRQANVISPTASRSALEKTKQKEEKSFFDWPLNLFCSGGESTEDDDGDAIDRTSWREDQDNMLELLGCANIIIAVMNLPKPYQPRWCAS